MKRIQIPNEQLAHAYPEFMWKRIPRRRKKVIRHLLTTALARALDCDPREVKLLMGKPGTP